MGDKSPQNDKAACFSIVWVLDGGYSCRTTIWRNKLNKKVKGLVHWDDPEVWNGEGGGRRVQDGEHMYTCGVLIFIFGKNNTFM